MKKNHCKHWHNGWTASGWMPDCSIWKSSPLMRMQFVFFLSGFLGLFLLTYFSLTDDAVFWLMHLQSGHGLSGHFGALMLVSSLPARCYLKLMNAACWLSRCDSSMSVRRTWAQACISCLGLCSDFVRDPRWTSSLCACGFSLLLRTEMHSNVIL